MKISFFSIFFFLVLSVQTAKADLLFSDSFESNDWSQAGSIPKYSQSSDFHTVGNYSLFTNDWGSFKKALIYTPQSFWIEFSYKGVSGSPFVWIGFGGVSNIECGTYVGLLQDSSTHDVDVYFDQTNFYINLDNSSYVLSSNQITTGCSTAKNNFYIYNNMSGKNYYIDNLRIYVGQQPYEFTQEYVDYWQYDNSVPDIKVNQGTICFLDDVNCNIEVSYNDLAVGSILYYIPINSRSDSTNCLPENAEQYYSLSSSSRTQTFNIASSTSGGVVGEKNYCLWLEKNDFEYLGNYGYSSKHSPFYILWEETENYSSSFTPYEDPCSNVASSTGDFWDDMRYGIECGIAKVSYYLIKPSPYSVKKVHTIMSEGSQMFPFSLYKQISTFMQPASSTLEMQLEMNITELTGIPGGNQDLVLLSKDTFSDWGVVYDKVYSFIEFLIYLGTFLYLLSDFIGRVKNREYAA